MEQYVTAETRKNWNLRSKHYVWMVWTAQTRILEQRTTSSDIHDQEVLDSLSDRREGRVECQQASIIELTRPDSTRFGNVQCQSHWMGKSPIPGLCNVLYPLGDGRAFYQRFLIYPCVIPVEAYTLGWGRYINTDSIRALLLNCLFNEHSQYYALKRTRTSTLFSTRFWVSRVYHFTTKASWKCILFHEYDIYLVWCMEYMTKVDLLIGHVI